MKEIDWPIRQQPKNNIFGQLVGCYWYPINTFPVCFTHKSKCGYRFWELQPEI